MHKTAFTTIYGTFMSNIMQQGNCNVPSTFQCAMNSIFCEYIGIFLHTYLDNLFVYSNLVQEHQKHLGMVFKKLREHELYLREEKCELFVAKVNCLGHMIDEKGLHVDADKYWKPLHEKCFQMIKAICCRMPMLCPIETKKDEPIWVICDASVYGVGVMYGQGETWQTSRPAGFMSRKFMDAQCHYWVYEQETLTILEALVTSHIRNSEELHRKRNIGPPWSFRPIYHCFIFYIISFDLLIYVVVLIITYLCTIVSSWLI